jgi:anti-sigma regulatory factor (Ser/Thr protein kinase)
MLHQISNDRIIEPVRGIPEGLTCHSPGPCLSRAAELHVSALPLAVPQARRHARSVLGGWGLRHLSPVAELVISELVTNAIAAHSALPGPSLVGLRIEAHADAVIVMVADASPAEPVLVPPDDAAPGGRGLHIVSAIAADWGFIRHDRGKTVWAAITS